MARGEPKGYDERIYRKGPQGMSFAAVGAIVIALVLVGSYLAATKEIPFTGGYEAKAVFNNAANIRNGSPVRIAGVNVGEVTGVESVGSAAEVTFTVSDDGLPLKQDATVRIRPRIFLEGNFFLDVHPGSPSAEELSDGGTIPVTRTATAVQLDEILTSLQAPSRENLKKLLEGYGTGLTHIPTASEDIGQDPDVQGESAAQAINDSFEYGGPAGRDTAITNEALLGSDPGDLSGLIAAQGRIFSTLLTREAQLQDLVTNFNTTVGAFAAESTNLGESVRLLAPTLEVAEPALRNTNDTFPYLRAFARDITPGIKEIPATIVAAGPWLEQTRELLRPGEFGYIADELRRAAPGVGIAAADGAKFLSQVELLGRCADEVLLPTGDPVLT
ncbi:MAG: MlaD family protein, partial [Actinomycetota bacterium]|nr:MlaD family protein [Actinomycetota bacterium]